MWDIEAAPAWDNGGDDYEPLNTRFIGAGVYDGTTYHFCDSTNKLFNLLTSDFCANSIIYAHNGSRYDCSFIIPYVVNSGIKATMVYVGQRLWIFFPDRVIADSMAILPTSLEKAAKMLDVSHQKYKIDYRHIEDEDWRPYLKNDCYSLYETITTFRALIRDMGADVKLTLASTAMQLFRATYQAFPLKTFPAIHDEERAAMYGGRTEVFKKHANDIQYYDINSSYSNSALTDLPVQYLSTHKTGIIEQNDICRARVSIPECHIPALPFRGEKLLFPWGTWEGWYTGRELLYARELYGNKAVKPLTIHKYESDDYLADYARDLFKLKKGGNPAAKLLLNSLYGRFGLGLDREKIVFRPNHEDVSKKHMVPINEEELIYVCPEKIDSFAFPSVFAQITADARINLHKTMCQVGEKTACYCDTDSIITTTKTTKGINKGGELGQWKLEGTFKRFWAVAPKLYAVDNKITAKGFRAGDSTPEQFFNSGHIKQHRMIGVKAQLKKPEKPHLQFHERSIRINDNKRQWDGNNSKPWRIEQ